MSTVAPKSVHWYRSFLQGRTRIFVAWIFAFLLALSARQWPNGYGIAICFLGASLRFWGSGYLRKDRFPAVSGPYAFTRNPLYLGTYMMALGVAVAIEQWALLALMSVVFGAIYHFIILDEEGYLDTLFGETYQTYKRGVFRFFPQPWPLARATRLKVNPQESHHHFSWELAMQNRAYDAYASFAGLVGGTYLVAWMWKFSGL